MTIEQLGAAPAWEWPADAAEQILGVLSNPRASDSQRLLAAELAGDLTVMSDEMARTLLELIRREDEDPRIRSRCAISLGPVLEEGEAEGFDDPELVSIGESVFRQIKLELRDLYQDPAIPVEVRRMALEASVRATDGWHAGAVRAAYFDGDPEWKLTAVFCMRFLPGFEDEILEAMDTQDPRILRQAILAAGAWELDQAWLPVHGILLRTMEGGVPVPEDPEAGRGLLLAAIHTSSVIRPEEATDLLEGMLDQLALMEDGLGFAEGDLSDAVEDALETARLLGGEAEFLEADIAGEIAPFMDSSIFPQEDEGSPESPFLAEGGFLIDDGLGDELSPGEDEEMEEHISLEEYLREEEGDPDEEEDLE